MYMRENDCVNLNTRENDCVSFSKSRKSSKLSRRFIRAHKERKMKPEGRKSE